jgi:hypothetical protein
MNRNKAKQASDGSSNYSIKYYSVVLETEKVEPVCVFRFFGVHTGTRFSIGQVKRTGF